MLAELVTGGPLWAFDGISELVHAKLHPEPVLAKVPPTARRIVAALIDPDPAKRPNAAQARALLRSVADGSLTFPPIDLRAQKIATVARRREIETPPASEPDRGGRAWWLIAILAAIVALGAVGYVVWTGPP